MATQVKQASEQNTKKSGEERAVETAQQIWAKNGKTIGWVLTIIIALIAGYVVYKYYFKLPEEQKAEAAVWKAQDYYKLDSFSKALNGDGQNQGFLRIISKYGGTKVGNTSKFYAGSCYLQLGDYKNAIKYLSDFSTDVPEVKIRAYGLLGDAYAESGKKDDAIENYKKAGTAYDKDEITSPEYLFRAALLSQDAGKNQQAIELFKELKSKYPLNPRAQEADKYLGKLGVTKQE
jgi:TolA-binding protein